ncbi:protein-glutamine glutaminase family protein [Leadbetterella sp. DM7]|uniref:protein-glutamine glutaminase family protein n=1 Tax=Leadbetterella sp. DM7 TaxID=3235085 RepID=UPI00349EE29C
MTPDPKNILEENNRLKIEELIKEDEKRLPVMSKGVLDEILEVIQERLDIKRITPEKPSASCYDVAQKVSEIINDPRSNKSGMSFRCTKIFAYGRRVMKPDRGLEWDNHEAVLVKVSQNKKWNYGNYIVTKVIDPLITEKAICMDEWICRLASLHNDSKPDNTYNELALSFMIFPSFFARPIHLAYSELYSNLLLSANATPEDMTNPSPFLRNVNK